MSDENFQPNYETIDSLLQTLKRHAWYCPEHNGAWSYKCWACVDRDRAIQAIKQLRAENLQHNQGVK